MNSIAITIQPGNVKRKAIVEIDVDRFERLVASLGLFRDGFLESLDKAEMDFRSGRVKKIRSLTELRTR